MNDARDASSAGNAERSRIRSNDRRLRALIDRLPGAVYRCTYDTEWVSLYMGDGFADICGIPPETLDPSGRSFKDVVVSEDLDKIRQAVREAIDRRSYYAVEYRIEANDGSIYWVEDNGRPCFDDDGNVKWLDGILLDITSRKKAQEALRRMNDTLEEKVEERTRQLRRLSAKLAMAEQRERDEIARILHDDLQQFLYGVQVQARMLVNGLDDHPDVAPEDLPVDPGRVEDLLREAIETIRGLTVDLSPPVLESDGLMEALQWLRSHLAETRDFTVVLDGAVPTESMSEGLEMVLFQAIRELLLNTYEHADVDCATVEAGLDDGDLLIMVSDDGCGFDHDETQKGSEGGFGLRNVRERLRFFGCSFSIDTAPGQGTACTIRIPSVELTASDPPAVSSSASS